MITYNAINVPLPEIEQDRVSDWIARVAASYGKRIDQVNRQFIGHDYYTDHIGFDNCQGNFLSGDTYISLDTVRTNAELFGTPYDEELHRVIIHSILHLCGIDDHTDEERQEMEEAEDTALSHLALNPNR